MENLRVEHGVAKMPHRIEKLQQMEKIGIGVLQECNILFFVALQCVSLRHSKTQHLVRKKTNNFNDLTVKNRLTAVVMPLHHVA